MVLTRDGDGSTQVTTTNPLTGGYEFNDVAYGSYRIQGTKSFVTSGGYADSYVVSAVAEGADVALGQFSCLLVPSDAEGLSWKGTWAGLGMRGNASRVLELAGV